MIGEISGDLLQWLRGFYFVAMKGSLQHASIAMGREKGTISRQIQCLEKELGVTLFDRSSGKMLITQEGKILLEKANMLFEYLARVKDDLKNEQTNYQGEICIATTHGVSYNVLPTYVDRFRQMHPKVTFQIEGANREEVYEKVESAEVDFGIAYSETGHKTILFHDLYEASRIMIAPKNNPFFPGKTLPSLEQIAKAPLILSVYHNTHNTPIEERFFAEGLKPNVVMRHNNFLTIKQYVLQGIGISIHGELSISKRDEQDLDIYKLDPYFPKLTYGILLKKGRYISEMVKAFILTIKSDINFSANQKL